MAPSRSFRIVITLFALVWLSLASGNRLPRPKLYGDAIPQHDLDPRNVGTQQKIVLIHNFYRSRVSPPAGDMLEMTWHNGASEDAQRWADSCQMLLHDNTTGRWQEDFGSCGQNIFIANVQVPWFFAIKVWFLEHHNFTFEADDNDPDVVGHYTQMVWHSSHKVGCGFQYCGTDVTKKPFYTYICNYCPIGNHPERFGMPYAKGEPCSRCPNHCKYNKLCTNACQYADLWANCAELNGTWHQWLCEDIQTERYKSCRATCDCNGMIR